MSNEERFRFTLEQIKQWAEAYPLKVFPEPDLVKARELSLRRSHVLVPL